MVTTFNMAYNRPHHQNPLSFLISSNPDGSSFQFHLITSNYFFESNLKFFALNPTEFVHVTLVQCHMKATERDTDLQGLREYIACV